MYSALGEYFNGDFILLTLAISYAHEDEPLVDALKKHLSSLERQGLVKPWLDRYIDPGTDFKSEIGKKFKLAEIILLMISSDFINSKFCYEIEMKIALSRSEKKDAIVIPVILRPCDWEDLPFGNIKAVPKDGKPIETTGNRDEGFLEVVKEVKNAAKKLLQIKNLTTDGEQSQFPTDSTKVRGSPEQIISTTPQTIQAGERGSFLNERNNRFLRW